MGITEDMWKNSKKIDFGKELSAAEAEAKAWKTIWSAGQGVTSILVNDEVVVQNLTLDSSFRGINLKLGEGFNKIDFIALNQGDSGPNTAELRIYDDNKKLISSNLDSHDFLVEISRSVSKNQHRYDQYWTKTSLGRPSRGHFYFFFR